MQQQRLRDQSIIQDNSIDNYAKYSQHQYNSKYLEQNNVDLGILHSADEHGNQVSDVRHKDLLADLMLSQ